MGEEGEFADDYERGGFEEFVGRGDGEWDNGGGYGWGGGEFGYAVGGWVWEGEVVAFVGCWALVV